MFRKYTLLIVIPVLCIVFTALPLTIVWAEGPDTSPWPCFGGNEMRTSLSEYYTDYIDGTLMWVYHIGNAVASPVVGEDGTVYAGSADGNLYAIRPDGTLKWKFESSPVMGDGEPIHFEFESSPAIGRDGTIYFNSWDGNLYAINPDGTLRWKSEVLGMSATPAIGSDGTNYTRSADGNLYAIDPQNILKWTFPVDKIVLSSPAIGANGTTYSGSYDGNLYAVNSVGTLKWKYQTGGSIDSTPAIGRDGTIYTGSSDGCLYAINPNGTLKWKFTAEGGLSSPAIGEDGIIYVGSLDGNLYALGSKTPSMPRNLHTTLTDKVVLLTWEEPAHTGKANISGYMVYWGSLDGMHTGKEAVEDVLNYTVEGLKSGERYWFAVSAVNPYGEGPMSEKRWVTLPGENGTKTSKGSGGEGLEVQVLVLGGLVLMVCIVAVLLFYKKGGSHKG